MSADDVVELIQRSRAEILELYDRGLDAASATIARDPVARQQVLNHGGHILDDVVASLRAGRVRIDETYKMAAQLSGVTRAAHGMHPRESLKTASAFFNTTVSYLTPLLRPDPAVMEQFALAVLVLNQSLSMRLGEGLTSYSGFLLSKIHQVHVEERRRIARELHDRVGTGLAVAHRQLELFEMFTEVDPVKAANSIGIAQQCTREAMQSLRAVTSELRLQEPLKSLEKALLHFSDSLPAGMTCQLTINGDETWASPSVRDECFLILREAIRNASSHGKATAAVVRVDIAPHELRGSVHDNGQGFDVGLTPASDGVGLWTMQERAELMGGTVTVTSEVGRGTLVELLVPLTGHRSDSVA